MLLQVVLQPESPIGARAGGVAAAATAESCNAIIAIAIRTIAAAGISTAPLWKYGQLVLPTS